MGLSSALGQARELLQQQVHSRVLSQGTGDLDSGISGDTSDLPGRRGIDEGMLPHIDLQAEGMKEMSTEDGYGHISDT